MDFLYFDLQNQVLICTRFKYSLIPGSISTHLSTIHAEEVTKVERKDCVEFWKDKPIRPAYEIQQLSLPITTLPIPYLALYHNGVSCRLCVNNAYVCGLNSPSHMRRHLRLVHKWTNGTNGGRPPKVRPDGKPLTLFHTVTTSPVSYQTFHRSNFMRFFQVATPPLLLLPNISTHGTNQFTPPATLQDQIELQLAEKLQAREAETSSLCQPPTEPSSWLQTTEWIRIQVQVLKESTILCS